MQNDLLIYSIFNLWELVQRGILRQLGAYRFQFTRDYLHDPVFVHPAKPHLDPLPAAGRWKANAGNIIRLLDMSSPEPTVPKANQKTFAFQFELDGAAYQGYYGPVRFYTGSEGPPAPEYAGDAPVSGVMRNKTYYVGGQMVYLEGVGYDPEGFEVSYRWVQKSGPVVTIFDANKRRCRFMAPYVFEWTKLTFQLNVSDGIQTSTAEIEVVVQPGV